MILQVNASDPKKILSPMKELSKDQVVGGVTAYQADDPLLVWEDDQPHWD